MGVHPPAFERKRSFVQEVAQLYGCPFAQLCLAIALWLGNFRSVNSSQTDFLTSIPNRIAVDHAGETDRSTANREPSGFLIDAVGLWSPRQEGPVSSNPAAPSLVQNKSDQERTEYERPPAGDPTSK